LIIVRIQIRHCERFFSKLFFEPSRQRHFKERPFFESRPPNLPGKVRHERGMQRGRPPKHDKLTNSEKAKKYRERKKKQHEEIFERMQQEIQALKAEVASYKMQYEFCKKELDATKHVLKILRENNAAKKVATPKKNSGSSPKI
jgi:L-lactate utilization protein LutB